MLCCGVFWYNNLISSYYIARYLYNSYDTISASCYQSLQSRMLSNISVLDLERERERDRERERQRERDRGRNRWIGRERNRKKCIGRVRKKPIFQVTNHIARDCYLKASSSLKRYVAFGMLFVWQKLEKSTFTPGFRLISVVYFFWHHAKPVELQV